MSSEYEIDMNKIHYFMFWQLDEVFAERAKLFCQNKAKTGCKTDILCRKIENYDREPRGEKHIKHLKNLFQKVLYE